MGSGGREYSLHECALLCSGGAGRCIGARHSMTGVTRMKTAVQVTMYLTESDDWDQVLRMLRRENVAGASVFHAVAGFLGRNRVHTASLVEAGGNLPVVVIFVDYEEHISRVLPKLFEMVPHRLIVRENVTIEQDALE